MAEAYFESGDRENAVNKLEQLVNLQGTEGSPASIEDLAASLDLYEKTVSSFQQGNGSQWQQNLEKMRQITIRDKADRIESRDTAISSSSQIPIEEEDAISLLDISAMEPVIRINEEDDTLFLEEEIEDFKEQFVELEDEHPEEEEPQPSSMIPSEEESPFPPTTLEPQQPLPSELPPIPEEYPPEFMESPEPELKEEGKPEEEKKKEEGEKLNIAGMMNYLFDLSHDLPEEKKEILIENSIPLKMASVIKRLSGGNRFKEKVSKYDRRNRIRSDYKINEKKIGDSMSAFKKLTDQHPDNLISSTFKKKMDELIKKLKPYL